MINEEDSDAAIWTIIHRRELVAYKRGYQAGFNDGRDDRIDANKLAKALGARGGAKGGPARAAALSPERRHEIAKKAALIRWGYQ